MDPLVRVLRKVRARLAFAHWMRVTVTFLLVGGGAACSWLVLTRLFPMLGDAAPVSAALMGAGVAIASGLAWFRRPSLLTAALEADRRLGLQERLTSSLELAQSEGAMVQALHEDARNCLSRLMLRRDFPFVAPRALRWLGVVAVVYLSGAFWLPEFDLLSYRARQAQAKARAEAVQVTVERLESAARALREKVGDVPGGRVRLRGNWTGLPKGLKRADSPTNKPWPRSRI